MREGKPYGQSPGPAQQARARLIPRSLFWAAAVLILFAVAGCASQIDTAITVQPDGTWSGEVRLILAAPLPAQSGVPGELDLRVQEAAADLLGGLDVGYTVSSASGADGTSVYTLQLSGGEPSVLSRILADSKAVVEGLAGPVALQVSGEVTAGQTLELALPGNPSTGNAWVLDPGQSAGLEAVGEVESQQLGPGLGTLARQVLRFQATRTGEAQMSLIYRRPWLAGAAPTRTFSIRADGMDLGQLLAAISLPVPAPAVAAPQPAPEQAAPASSAPEGLPTAYNWCSLGWCTPVKDQENCGSCWAFGTVAPLESAIKKQDGVTTDLSEQYLVSCNTDGWGCGGGWWAHNYHQWKFSPPETQAGAVPESSFPYMAWDVPCGGPYPHPYKITTWAYVGPIDAVPPVNDLKQALLDHGPLSVAVCVGPGWNLYSGGVFATDETVQCAPYAINHAVTLVGWDDFYQAWTIKNSWGQLWGDGGYMHIKYGTSNIGYAANYIQYTPPVPRDNIVYLPLVLRNWSSGRPATPTLSPIDNPDGDGYYTVSWSVSAGATNYTLQEDDNSGFSTPATAYSGPDSSVPIAGKPAGTYYYRVAACNGYGCSGWSNVRSVTVNPSGWRTLVSTDFEGSFPGPWTVLDNYWWDSAEYYWAKRDCGAPVGSYSGWAVGGGAQGSALGCGSYYPNYASSWMIYGPFSLEGATAADLSLQLWLNSESCCDGLFWGASIDYSWFYGYGMSGNTGGWTAPPALDLSDVPDLGNLLGQPQVWVALVFDSDYALNYPEGAYVDDIVLRKFSGPRAAPVPGPAPTLPPGVRERIMTLSLGDEAPRGGPSWQPRLGR